MLRSIKVDTYNGDDENVTDTPLGCSGIRKDVGCGVAASLHILWYVAEKVMHPVNEVGGVFAELEAF